MKRNGKQRFAEAKPNTEMGRPSPGNGYRPRPPWNPRAWLVALPLVVIVVIPFTPVLDNGFVNLDDDKNFLDNLFYRGLTAETIRWALTTFWVGVYQPLAWLMFEVEFSLWKLAPRGYHLTSVILHSANAVVLYMLTLTVLSRSRSDSPARGGWISPLSAGLATALFAVHPLRVEPVAWASSQPYLLCALFSILAVLAYLHSFAAGSSPRSSGLVCTFSIFVAAVMSKAPAVSLPPVLLILDVYPLRRFGVGPGQWFGPVARRIYFEKLPFIVVSLLFMGLAIAARGLSLASAAPARPGEGIARACHGVWFYLEKTCVPLDLVAAYPLPGRIDWLAPPFLWRIAATLAVTVALFALRRRWPALLTVWLIYLLILAPNSGLISFSGQIAGDRYSYMAMLATVPLMAYGFCRLWRASLRYRPLVVVLNSVLILILAGLMALTWNQCQTWRNSQILWTYALEHGAEGSSVAHYNMAIVRYTQNKLGAATAESARAIELDPRDFTVQNFLGIVYQRQGKLEEAAAQFRRTIELQPDYRDAYYNLGIILSRQGKFDEAAARYAEVIRLDPTFADAHHNLGIDAAIRGKLADARAHYTEALRLNPGRADTHDNLGLVLSRLGKLEEAQAHFAEAIRLDPGLVDARKNLEAARGRAVRSGEITAP